MGFFNSMKKLLKQADDVEKMAHEGIDQARSITKMIPGDKDDKLVESVADKVDAVTKQFDGIKKNIPKSK